jgi:lysophospholipase L1-like esterase
MTQQPTETVACLGSSTTAAKGTYNWIAALHRRPQNTRFRFANFGVGGDLSFNTVQRVDSALRLRPKRAIVLVGTNDILASVFPNFRRIVRVWKRPPGDPSPAALGHNLATTVAKLRQDGTLTIGLTSLAVVGEDPHSSDPVQSRLNELFAVYNGVIRDLAASEGVHYIPFYESFEDALHHAQTAKPFTRFSFPAFYRDYLVRELILRRSFDEISRLNGWSFHIDGIHLNTRGGEILTEVVQRFLDSPPDD